MGAACKGIYSCGYLFPLFAYMANEQKKNITNVTTGKELGNWKKRTWLKFFRENRSEQAMGNKSNLYFLLRKLNTNLIELFRNFRNAEKRTVDVGWYF